MARRTKPRRPFARRSLQAQLKVRLPEVLRYTLEQRARARGHSMNTEIVRRLADSIMSTDNPAKVVAEALLNCLDDEVVNEIVEIVMQTEAEEEMAELQREEKQIREGSK